MSDGNSVHNEFDHASGPVQILNSTKVDKTVRKSKDSSNLPLIAVLNARSLYNKAENFKDFIEELGVEVALVSET